MVSVVIHLATLAKFENYVIGSSALADVGKNWLFTHFGVAGQSIERDGERERESISRKFSLRIDFLDGARRL